MTIRKLTNSSIKSSVFYKSMLAQNPAYIPTVTAEVLIVAGGAAGSTGFGAGGGGAGAVYYHPGIALSAGTNYSVTVGAGGAAQPGSTRGYGGNGSVSIFGSAGPVGGGPGGWWDTTYRTPISGGCGGGGGGNPGNVNGQMPGASGNDMAPLGYTGYGKSGGKSYYASTGQSRGGGGGGAGAIGGDASTSNGPNFNAGVGGDGVQFSITGTALYYGGGGGGGNTDTGGDSPGAIGGLGGGGRGADATRTSTAGEANTGGGGGGDANSSIRPASNGGSGVVILRYPATFNITIGSGLSGSTQIVGGNKVTTITAGTGNVIWL